MSPWIRVRKYSNTHALIFLGENDKETLLDAILVALSMETLQEGGVFVLEPKCSDQCICWSSRDSGAILQKC